MVGQRKNIAARDTINRNNSMDRLSKFKGTSSSNSMTSDLIKSVLDFGQRI